MPLPLLVYYTEVAVSCTFLFKYMLKIQFLALYLGHLIVFVISVITFLPLVCWGCWFLCFFALSIC
uniref:Putative ovule protein n=1 Tax=Solanum chacoense TaxID=4108 RepID=A0A0V0IF00_SOLCH